MIEKELFPRHGGSSHYANIPSGYYLLLSCFIFIALISFTRKFLLQGANQGFIKWIYGFNPIFLFLYFTLTIIALVFPLFITQHDHYYNVFTKRLGRIAYGFTNLIILIMLQEPLSIFNGMISYLEFIPLHKWLSRGIFGISILHGILFILKWYRDPEVSLWEKMVVKKANFIGFVIFIEFCFMSIISMKPLRHKSYKFFYFSHQLINLSFIILIPFHARPRVTFPFLIINIFLMVIYCLNKTWKGHRISISDKIETFENQFYIVTLPSTELYMELPTPGSHLRISPFARYNWKYWLLPSHPYTIATSSPHEVKLIIKKTNFIIDENHQYTICGPLPNHSIERLIQCEEILNHIILIAGGSGISFILPIYYYLLNNKDSTMSFQSLRFIWLVKDIVEYKFIRNNVGLSEEYFKDMDIYITATDVTTTETDMMNDNSNEDDIELQNFIPIRKENNMDDKNTIGEEKIKYGRINWDLDLQDLCLEDGAYNNNNQGNNKNNYIIGCGPNNLIKDCENFGSKNNYHVITEYYSI